HAGLQLHFPQPVPERLGGPARLARNSAGCCSDLSNRDRERWGQTGTEFRRSHRLCSPYPPIAEPALEKSGIGDVRHCQPLELLECAPCEQNRSASTTTARVRTHPLQRSVQYWKGRRVTASLSVDRSPRDS